MRKSKTRHLFDTKILLNNIEKVIQIGLNDILSNYIERYTLLEKTHKKIMKLSSVVYRITKTKHLLKSDPDESESDESDESDESEESDESKSKTKVYNDNQISDFEKKLEKLEKNYNLIISILDEIFNKINCFNNDFKDIKEIMTKNNKNITVENSFIDKSSENENIQFLIQEDNQSLKSNDFNPITLLNLNNIQDEEQEEEEEEEDEEERQVRTLSF